MEHETGHGDGGMDHDDGLGHTHDDGSGMGSDMGGHDMGSDMGSDMGGSDMGGHDHGHDHDPLPGGRGTAGDDMLHATRGGIFGFAGNDTMMATAQNGVGQIHTYGATGDDANIMGFASITRFSHGHHVRGGEGADTFSFVDTANVQSTIVGRIEDFDSSQDRLLIEGQEIDLNNLPSNVRLVAYNGLYHDQTATPQPYLWIQTLGGGNIFYAFEGARVDMTTEDAQEGHFLLEAPDFSALEDIAYIDPKNYVPAGFEADGGIVIQDTDVVRADVLEDILDTDGGDLIAAGLNDDRVLANLGNDRIWAGSGDDFVFAGVGHDTIEGGSGNDILRAGSGNDIVQGGLGDDVIIGGAGRDLLEGGDGNDEIHGAAGHDTLLGGAGDDTLDGGNRNDRIDGGAGRDVMTGGTGADTFVFTEFDWGFDVVTDFDGAQDVIAFEGTIGGFDDLLILNYMYEGTLSTLIRFTDESGAMDRGMGGIVLAGVDAESVLAEDFLF